MNNKSMATQSGQVILILLLVITIGLGVGLSVIQRSIQEVSTSTKIEESSRAFSAAEAGIEQALVQLSEGQLPQNVNFPQNQSQAVIDTSGTLPALNQIFELPPISKENVAQVYLATPATAPASSSTFYNQSNLDIYWGDINANPKPAIEVAVLYLQGGNIKKKAFYFDPDSARASSNGFTTLTCSNVKINTSFGNNRNFACKATLSGLGSGDLGVGRVLLLARARIFYTNTSHPVAVAPLGGPCDNNPSCSLPPQATVIISTGTAGQTERRVQLFRQDNFVPEFFDYAIFSLAAINK